MALLKFFEPNSPANFELDETETTIGRRPENSIVLTGVTVSGRHARIYKAGEHYVLEDVGSRNGTHVNLDRIQGPTKLNHNDQVHFGKTEAKFLDPAQAGSPSDSGKKTVYGRTSGTVVMESGTDEAGTAPDIVQPAPRIGESASGYARRTGLKFVTEDRNQSVDSTLMAASAFGSLNANPQAKLTAILDISGRLAGASDPEAIMPQILDTLFEIFKFAERGCILLQNESTGELLPTAMKHRRETGDDTIRMSRTILNRVINEKTGVISGDAASDFEESDSIMDLKIRSIMCVPLLSRDGHAIGAINLDSQNPLGKFKQDDLELLMTVAGQAALSYESARLFRSHLEKEKQDSEMEIAKGVQQALLPADLPSVTGYRFFASYDAARAIGGDYYDCFLLPNGKVCISMGDVAGKGVPGALVMSRMHSCVQSTLQHVMEVVPAMNAINEHMCQNMVDGVFVTYVLGILDPVTHELTLSVAGHPSPIVRHLDGTYSRFDDENFGPPIGIIDDWTYQSETISLALGDSIVIITDGVDEAMNSADELFGMQRVLQIVQQAGAEPDLLGAALIQAVRKHAAGYPQSDDITIFAFGRTAAQPA